MARKLKGTPKGRGKLKCGICHKPTRDHDVLGPCPEIRLLAGERMTVQRPFRGRRS